jgi:hypothetical protein
VRRDLPREKILSRIDRRRVQEVLEARNSSPLATATTDWMVRGGIARLLESLDEHFQFAAPVGQTQGTFPVWVLQGTWRPEKLKLIWPGVAEASELPEHLPDFVVVILARDPAWHLIPVCIDYRRGRGGESQSLAVMEMTAIAQPDVNPDPRTFSYNPGQQEVLDYTEQYLAERLSQPP